MAEPINIQDMIDGRLDIKSLGEAANGDENTQVVTRTGQTYPSASKAIKTMFEAGGLPATPFATKALMTASALTDGKHAMVTDDTVAGNNGLYIKKAGVWAKSEYDPVSTSKNYVDLRMGLSTTKNRLYELKDSDGNVVIIIDNHGSIFAPKLSGSLQDALNEVKNSVYSDTEENILALKDASGNSVFIINKNGDIFATGLDKPIQDYLKALSTSQNGSSALLTVEGERAANKALYVVLPDGFTASSYQWQKDGKNIEGGNKSYYILQQSDLYSDITVHTEGVSGGYTVLDNSGITIGGVAIGDTGKVGTIYDGYILSAGDDFTELDIIAPHKPLGRWFTTRTYLAGARGSDTLLGTMYDTDPYHLGYNDSNRGAPVGYENMSHDGSVLTLNSRLASDYEKSHMQGNRNEVAAMISSVGAFSMYAGAADGGENILEWRVRHTLAETNPAGWHPSLWTQSSLPSATYNSNEWDISEGNSKYSTTNYNEWGGNGGKVDGVGYGRTMSIMDGKWHLVSAIFSHTKVEIYLDGGLVKTITKDANSFNEPAYALVSSHIYNGGFSGESYSKAEWDSLTRGATQEVDFIRLWRKTGKSHIKPLVTVPPINIAYGETGTITLPSKMALWGRDDVLEHVQTVMTEENEPGGHHTQAYNSLPSFITYDDLTRTATINTAAQKSGRLNFVIYGYLQDGSTCEPARTYANVAPRIDITSINTTANASYDLYAKCDCGVLVTDGVKRTKAINVTGLPINAVYNDNTGLIYINNTSIGTYPITVQCINSVGQSTTKTINLIIT